MSNRDYAIFTSGKCESVKYKLSIMYSCKTEWNRAAVGLLNPLNQQQEDRTGLKITGLGYFTVYDIVGSGLFLFCFYDWSNQIWIFVFCFLMTAFALKHSYHIRDGQISNPDTWNSRYGVWAFRFLIHSRQKENQTIAWWYLAVKCNMLHMLGAMNPLNAVTHMGQSR